MHMNMSQTGELQQETGFLLLLTVLLCGSMSTEYLRGTIPMSQTSELQQEQKYHIHMSFSTYPQRTKLHFCSLFMKLPWAEQWIVTLSTRVKQRSLMSYPYYGVLLGCVWLGNKVERNVMVPFHQNGSVPSLCLVGAVQRNGMVTFWCLV